MKKNSNRLIRINQEVMQDLTAIIRGDLKDPRIHPLTSVVSVDVTPDLKYCKVFVSVLGDERAQKETLEGLKNSAGHIRTELAHRTNLRNTPQLSFVMDHSIEYGVEMTAKIDHLREQEAANAAEREEEETE